MDILTIDATELKPAHACLLYNALIFFKENAEAAFAETIMNPGNHPAYQRQFFKHTETEAKNLIDIIFGNATNVDEMEFIKDFNRNYNKTLSSDFFGKVIPDGIV